MARFVFQLEGVLKHRTQLEQQKMRVVAEARATMAGFEAELRAMDEAVQAAAKQVRDNHLVGVLDMHFLAAHRRFMNAAQRQAMEVVQKLAKAKAQHDDAQKQLIEAAKQRKIIEKLREKQHARWQAEQARTEAIELDELSMQLAFRSALDGGEEHA
jgi:flagellar protein FliJ